MTRGDSAFAPSRLLPSRETPIGQGGPLAMTNRSRPFAMEALEDRTVPAQASLDPGFSLPDTTKPQFSTGHVHHIAVDLPQTGPNQGLNVGASSDAEVRYVQKLY